MAHYLRTGGLQSLLLCSRHIKKPWNQWNQDFFFQNINIRLEFVTVLSTEKIKLTWVRLKERKWQEKRPFWEWQARKKRECWRKTWGSMLPFSKLNLFWSRFVMELINTDCDGLSIKNFSEKFLTSDQKQNQKKATATAQQHCGKSDSLCHNVIRDALSLLVWTTFLCTCVNIPFNFVSKGFSVCVTRRIYYLI